MELLTYYNYIKSDHSLILIFFFDCLDSKIWNLWLIFFRRMAKCWRGSSFLGSVTSCSKCCFIGWSYNPFCCIFHFMDHKVEGNNKRIINFEIQWKKLFSRQLSLKPLKGLSTRSQPLRVRDKILTLLIFQSCLVIRHVFIS